MRVVGFGAGGHAKVLIDALRLCGMEIVGLTDANLALKGSDVNGIRVIGDDSLWPSLLRDGVRGAFIGVGSTGDSSIRRRLYEQARASGFEIIKVIHPAAVISPAAILGDGAIVMAGAIINAAAVLAENVIVNTAAVVEHDCVIGAHAHIATGARLASTIRVGEGAHVGIGASVRQCVSIGDNAVIGAGAAVVADVPAGAIVVGVPATRRIDAEAQR